MLCYALLLLGAKSKGKPGVPAISEHRASSPPTQESGEIPAGRMLRFYTATPDDDDDDDDCYYERILFLDLCWSLSARGN